MRRISKLIILPLIAVTLSSCDLLKMLDDLLYDNVEEFYKKEQYTETTSENEFNRILQEKMYVWRNDVRTYTNTDDVNNLYYSPNSDTILDYVRDNQITFYSKYGEKFVVRNGEKPSLSYRFEEQDEITFKEGVLNFIQVGDDGMGYIEDMDQEHENLLRMQEYDNGYLFLSNHQTMFYLAKDFKTIYPYVSHTQKFEFNGRSIELPESNLLAMGLAAQEERPLLALPLPENSSFHHKDHYDSDNVWSAYDVIIPNVNGVDYVESLKQSGFEVYRGEYHGFIEIDGENGGEWVAYDQNLEFKIHIQYKNPICAAKNGDNNRGVQLHIMPMKDTLGLFGRSPNKQTNWTDSEIAIMNEKYGFVLPFINLGRKYDIPNTKRKNGEYPLSSPFDMDTECYFIFDNFYKDVVTENYGSILEQAGFRKYVAPVTDRSSDPDAYKTWYYSHDVVFHQCYLNDDLKVAIKFGFDDIYGNCIRVFDYDDMVPWHDSLED